MYEQFTEAGAGLLLKISLLFLAGFFYVMSAFAETAVSQAFDQLFSIGLLVVFVIYMYMENKRKTAQREDAYRENVELLKLNIQAMNSYAEANKDIAKSVERSAELQTNALEKLTNAFEKVREDMKQDI